MNELERRVSEAEAALRPAEPGRAMAELAACLALVAPSGMAQEDRAEWLRVAVATVADLPAAALSAACLEVRKRCCRVSELVPMVVELAEPHRSRLRKALNYARQDFENPPRPALPKPSDDKPFTVDELVQMSPMLREMARRNGFADEATLAEADRILTGRRP